MNIKSLILPLLMLLTACGPMNEASEPSLQITTYHQDIKPLLQSNCLSCHRQGDVGLYPLESFEQAKAMGPAMVHAVESRTMPPWGHNPSCRPVQDSLWMNDEVIAIFSQWQTDGFEEGDASINNGELNQAIEETEYTEPDALIEAGELYIPDVGFADDYRCFILPYEFNETTFVYQNTIFPDRVDLVHHVIVYVGTANDRAYFENKDAQSEAPGFRCFGGTGVESAQMLGGWAPGQFAAGGDKKYAHQLSKGAVLIMQMHYNLAGKTADDVIDGDQTQLALWTLEPGETPDYLLSLMPVFDRSIEIPALESQWAEESLRRLPLNAEIIGTAPHMHLLGKSLKMELIREGGKTECLSQVDDWDFDWQRTYLYAEDNTLPISIEDEIKLECIYDNSEDNQPVIDGEKQASRQVEWGDGSTDEMCLDYLVLAAPYLGNGRSGFCAGVEECLNECPTGDAFCGLACPGTLGFQCLECAIDGFFGSCAQEHCTMPMIALGSCYDSCGNGNFLGYFNCIQGPCRDEFTAFYQCFEPHLKAGTCNDDFAECTGMFVEE